MEKGITGHAPLQVKHVQSKAQRCMGQEALDAEKKRMRLTDKRHRSAHEVVNVETIGIGLSNTNGKAFYNCIDLQPSILRNVKIRTAGLGWAGREKFMT